MYPRWSPHTHTRYMFIYTYSRYLPRTYTHIYIYTVQEPQQIARYRAVGACYTYDIYTRILPCVLCCTHAETKSTRSLVSGFAAMTNGRGLSINYIYLYISTYYNNIYIYIYRYTLHIEVRVCVYSESCI